MRLSPPVVAPTVLATLVLAASAAGAGETIGTVAGTGGGFGGDGGAATAAQLDSPTAVSLTGDGGYLIADRDNSRIRKVDVGGTITTVAGTTIGFSGDGGPATAAQLKNPSGVSPTPDGGVLIADTGNHRIRKVDANGFISTVAGNGVQGFKGEKTAAVNAKLNNPAGVLSIFDGSYLIADTGNHRVRKVSTDGLITTVAGSGVDGGFAGDDGKAAEAELNSPSAVSVIPTGGDILIADTGNHRIRRVNSFDTTITTVVGESTQGFDGDGGRANRAKLRSPRGVHALSGGGYLIADSGNNRIRRVDVNGFISTVAGAGTAGFGGDGGLATAALLNDPEGVFARDASGSSLLIADTENHRIRTVPAGAAAIPPPPPPAQPPAAQAPQRGSTLLATALRGEVRARLRGSRHFQLLPTGRSMLIPVGSTVEATRGLIELVFAEDAAGATVTAHASGRFNIGQEAGGSGAPVAELALSARLSGCPKRPQPGSAGGAARSSTHVRGHRRATVRRLRVQTTGAVRTRGRYATALARGTRWLTEDRCGERPGTLVQPIEGSVDVRDLVRRRTTSVKAGDRYLARAPKPPGLGSVARMTQGG